MKKGNLINVYSIGAKIVKSKPNGISYIVEFDNGNSYTCRMEFNGSNYVGSSLPKTFIQKNGGNGGVLANESAKVVVFESRDINNVIDFLVAIESQILCWNRCRNVGNVRIY